MNFGAVSMYRNGEARGIVAHGGRSRDSYSRWNRGTFQLVVLQVRSGANPV